MLTLRGGLTPSLLLVLPALLATAAPGNAQLLPSAAAAASTRPAPLNDELARVDSLLFDALFARCDAEHAHALLADDVEFYDDRAGLSIGDDLRADFRRLTSNCPAENGVRRVLLPESVEVRPIEGFGALQTGVHHFVERGASTSTVARFIHLWKRVGDGWKLARIISLHEVMEADRATDLRRQSSRSLP